MRLEILSGKDLILQIAHYNCELAELALDKKDFDWLSTLRKPLFIPENKKLDDLMQEFQEKKIHLAIVVDEFGGTSGVISLEDVIEEIVGDISDEFDDDSLLFSKLDNYNYVFEGKTSMKDFYKILNNEQLSVPSNFLMTFTLPA